MKSKNKILIFFTFLMILLSFSFVSAETSNYQILGVKDQSVAVGDNLLENINVYSYNTTVLNFDGNGGYVDVADNPALSFFNLNKTGTFIVEVKFNDDERGFLDSGIGVQNILFKGSGNNWEYSLTRSNSSDPSGKSIYFTEYRLSDGTSNRHTILNNYSYNKYYTIVVSLNNTHISSTVNGVESTPTSISYLDGDGINSLTIGRRQTISNTYLNASINKFLFLNTSLEHNQRNRHYYESKFGDNNGKSIPVIAFHNINNGSITYDFANESFYELMTYLNNEGYTTITFKDWLTWVNESFLMPEKPIILTFDDGYLDNYENAYPIMESYDQVGVFNIITDKVGDSNYANWNQIIEMKNSGWEIGSHTVTHIALNSTNETEIRRQFLQSKQSIEGNITNYEVTQFQTPYNTGQTNITIAQWCGEYYEICTSLMVGFDNDHWLYKKSHPFLYNDTYPIPRRTIINTTSVNEIIAFLNYKDSSILDYQMNDNSVGKIIDRNGFINGSFVNTLTWENSSEKVILDPVEYSFTSSSFTLLSSDYDYSVLFIDNTYTTLISLEEDQPSLNTDILAVKEIFLIASGLLSLIILGFMIPDIIRLISFKGSASILNKRILIMFLMLLVIGAVTGVAFLILNMLAAA